MDSPASALFLVSFGGPEGPNDVMPFLDNVLRGKPIPDERKQEVAEHYYAFGGVSPINEQNRVLVESIRLAFNQHGLDVPVYWGNRNWTPTIPEALEQMKADGIERAYAFFTSMFSCYSGCRQYRENIQTAQKDVGQGAPDVLKLRMGFNHPDFIEAQVSVVAKARSAFGCQKEQNQMTDPFFGGVVLFTAHSIPLGMARRSDYEMQLRESMGLAAERLNLQRYELVYQSRSGAPSHPWLEPDVCDRLEALAAEGVRKVILVPLGFISDHMEVLFDLDTEAKEVCDENGIRMVRAESISEQPEFIDMIVDLYRERVEGRDVRKVLGTLGPWHDVCPKNCCLPSARPGVKSERSV